MLHIQKMRDRKNEEGNGQRHEQREYRNDQVAKQVDV